jgi:hypothetical protein
MSYTLKGPKALSTLAPHLIWLDSPLEDIEMLRYKNWILRKRYPTHSTLEAKPFSSQQPLGGQWISFDSVTWSRYIFEGYTMHRIGQPVSDD